MTNDNRNLIVFALIAGLILLGYETFIVGPQARRIAAEQHTAQAVAPTASAGAAPTLSLAAALAQSARVRIDTPSLSGSINLKGGRFDDLLLKGYHDEVSTTSPLVDLLRPEGVTDAYYASQGWVGANLSGLPDDNSVWTLGGPGALTPTHPVSLTYAAPSGLTFTRTIAVDTKSMFTITDTVANQSAGPVTVAPYASVKRIGLPETVGKSGNVHEGATGVLAADTQQLKLSSYKDWKKKGSQEWPSHGGWLGVTDKYWMTTFIPPQNEPISASLRAAADPAGEDIYEAAYLGAARSIAPGAQTSETTHLFAGAKTMPALNAYKASLGIPRFDDAVDWGILSFLTKPIFTVLEFFYQKVGNFGVAILMLTVVIRVITFPLANRGFEMGVKMKKIQPELQALQKRLKEDPAAQQKEMMALYAREKVNPVTGCIPMLLPIPVFYALFKVLNVTIEARHAPFFGWIHDLSARDPTTILNLFGLIPWDPSMAPLIGPLLGGMLHLGVWPIAYGLAMWLTQAMTPMQGVDPAQQMMFRFMPLIFTFIMAQYAVGLLIYWTWSSLMTIVQQYVLMRRFKVGNPIDDFLGRFQAKPQGSG
jgi:YidC/Oxa1 family membrane protein insertase